MGIREIILTGIYRHIVNIIIGILFSYIVQAQGLPIKPARTVSFETNEGTYMDVNLSPDGNTIVFDLLGDIYTVPATGGTARQLTRGLAINRQPVWSPDGKQIAYVSDGSGRCQLQVMDADGSSQRMLGKPDVAFEYFGAGHPVWTPDGSCICINGYLYHLAGGQVALPDVIKNAIQLFDKKAVQFSSDGNLIYYNTREGLQCYDNQTARTTIKVKDTSSKYDKGFINPVVSPDGQWFTYIADGESSGREKDLRVRSLATGKDRILTKGIEIRRVMEERYCFTADSRQILIGFGGKLHRIDIQTGMSDTIPFTAKVNADLGPFNYNTFRVTHDSLKVRYTRSANASPDGKQLVFSALNHIYVMDLPSGRPHILVPQPFNQFQPQYSPDGKWIAYVSWSDTGAGHVWRVPTRGGRPERLTKIPAHYEHPTWSPDGTLIAVIMDTVNLKIDAGELFNGGALAQIQIIVPKEGKTRTLVDSIPEWNQLSFSNDGKRLSYMLDVIPGREKSVAVLASIGIDCDNPQVLAVEQSFENLYQVSLSPDNRYIVYGKAEDLYLVPVGNLGGSVLLNDGRDSLVPRIRFAKGGIDPHWEDGGKILSWSYSNHFYRVDPDKIVREAVNAAREGSKQDLTQNGMMSVAVTSDQSIDINLTVARHFGRGTIALRDVRILSMKGDEVTEHGTIVIRDGVYVAVGPMTTTPIPAHAKIMELAGKTVMPGLIDLHDHMLPPPDIFPQQLWSYLANLAYGVTTARDPSSSFDSFGYAEALETSQMRGPRLFSVGRTVASLQSLEDAREIVRKRKILGAVAVKEYIVFSRLERQWLQMASQEASLNMTNEGTEIWPQMAMMKDGCPGIEHNPIWGNVYKDVITFVSASQTFHTPTLQIAYGGGDKGIIYFEHQYRQHPDSKLSRFWRNEYLAGLMKDPPPVEEDHPNFLDVSKVEAIIRQRGGHVTMGSHGNSKGIGAHWEIWALQMGGLNNMEALQAATILGAEALGMQQDLGSVEPGKIADLLILNKNPLEDIRNTLSIQYVMKDGEIFDGNTLNALWPIKKKLPEWRLKFQQPIGH